MSRSPAPSPHGAPARAAAPVASRAAQRRHPADEMRQLSDDLDQAQRLESLGARSVADHERIVALVEAIAARACALKQHYRGPLTQLCRPPLYVSADGTCAGW